MQSDALIDAIRTIPIHYASSFKSAEELVRRLKTTVRDFHRAIKPRMKIDFQKEMKRLNSTNPDIGVDEDGKIILRNPQTGAEINTAVPLDSYAEE